MSPRTRYHVTRTNTIPHKTDILDDRPTNIHTIMAQRGCQRNEFMAELIAALSFTLGALLVWLGRDK